MNISAFLRELRAERDRIDQEIAALENRGKARGSEGPVLVTRRPARRTEHLSGDILLPRVFRLVLADWSRCCDRRQPRARPKRRSAPH